MIWSYTLFIWNMKLKKSWQMESLNMRNQDCCFCWLKVHKTKLDWFEEVIEKLQKLLARKCIGAENYVLVGRGHFSGEIDGLRDLYNFSSLCFHWHSHKFPQLWEQVQAVKWSPLKTTSKVRLGYEWQRWRMERALLTFSISARETPFFTHSSSCQRLSAFIGSQRRVSHGFPCSTTHLSIYL